MLKTTGDTRFTSLIEKQPSTKSRDQAKRDRVLAIEIAIISNRRDMGNFRKLSQEEVERLWGLL